jgi:CDP-L-myo-inositol myo-inositolphosphotransferase
MLIVRHGVPLTPNQVSLISFAVAILAAYLLAIGPHWLGGILVQLSSILDGVDGELARVTGRVSRRGGFLDAILDRYADIAVILGLTYYAARIHGMGLELLLLSLAALSGDIMVSYLHARGEASLHVHPVVIGQVPQLASRDVRLFIVFVGALLGRPLETLLLIALLSHGYAVAKTIDVYMKYVEEKQS